MRTIYNRNGSVKIRKLHNVTILCEPSTDGREQTFDGATIYFSDVFPEGMDLICVKGKDPFFIRHSLIRGILSPDFEIEPTRVQTKLFLRKCQDVSLTTVMYLNDPGPEELKDVLLL